MEHWNAIYVASRSEKKVAQRLTDYGIENYVPLKSEKKQWSDRLKTVVSPLINGYVFVKSNESIKDKILQIPSVVAFVRYNGKDAIVRNHEIETLKNIEKLGYDVDLYAEELKIDDLIEIFQGALKGIKAKVLNVNDDNTIYAVLLDSIGQSIRVKIPNAIAKKEKELC